MIEIDWNWLKLIEIDWNEIDWNWLKLIEIDWNEIDWNWLKLIEMITIFLYLFAQFFCCLGSATVLKRDSNTGVFLWNLGKF